jgi:hypothetical protein
MASAPIAAGHRVVFDLFLPSVAKTSSFLEETGFKCPTDPKNGIMQYALQTKREFYHYLSTRRSQFHDFNLFMAYAMGTRESWHQWYNIQERLLSGYDKSFGPLLVDIGGGKGQDLQAFHEIFNDKYEGNLVLQDLAPVLDSIEFLSLHVSIQKVSQDFFTAQPDSCHGARVYLLHHILHNWSDDFCLLILGHLRTAMKPGYSKLLIHEYILPDVGVAKMQGRFDLTMMTMNGGMERSQSQWKTLLGQAGLEVTDIFERKDADGVVEAVVRE